MTAEYSIPYIASIADLAGDRNVSVSLFTHAYVTEIMRGITLDAPPRMDLHVFSLREDGLVGAAELAEAGVDGVVLIGVENDAYLRAFETWDTPGVVVDYCSQAALLDFVVCDNRAAAQRVVAQLAALGHRRVAYASAPARSTVSDPTARRGSRPRGVGHGHLIRVSVPLGLGV